LTNSTWTAPPAGANQTFIDPTINGTVPAGALGILTPNGGGFDITLQIAPIPEPSTYFLGLVGGTALLGALRLRRARAAR